MSTDIPDLIAGALGVSRGTAYDMMREALAKQYAEKNSLGGPAKVFDAMADAIRAGDDYHAVLRQYGFVEAQQQEPAVWTATRLWNRKDTWTCPADIEKDLLDGRVMSAQQQEPVVLTDIEIQNCFQPRSKDKTKERRLITEQIVKTVLEKLR